MRPQPETGFRPARHHDAALLYWWRRQAEQKPWYNGQPLTRERHMQWLQERLDNPLVEILIWQERGHPAGMVRIDSNGELAFHVDQDAPAGTTRRMLHAATHYADQHGGRLKVTLDQANHTQRDQLLQAGFARYPAVLLAWKP